jgi:7-cyano-7-deazaguanine synthase
LLIAKEEFSEVHALTINYGQRHRVEIESALAVAELVGVDSHEVIKLGSILKGTSPLVSDNSVDTFNSPDEMPQGVATTFVPSRNAVFLTIASNHALARGIHTLITGVNQTDYSGYPDCRRDFINAMEQTISLGNFGKPHKFCIYTPLIYQTKAETVKLARRLLGAEKFEQVFELTTTCYQGVKGGCGRCAACLLRDRGFEEAGIDDPLWKFRKPMTEFYQQLPAIK